MNPSLSVSKEVAAQLLGIKPTSLYKHIKDKNIIENPDGTIPIESICNKLRNELEKAKKAKASTGDKKISQELQTVKLSLEKLKLRSKRGTVLDKDQVLRQLSVIAVILKEELEQFRLNSKQYLHASLHEKLTTDINQLLTKISNRIIAITDEQKK